MGIFSRFKKKQPEICGEMMNEEQFWSIIETSKQSSKHLEELASNISKALSKMSSKEMIGFHLREQKLRFDSYTSDLWCAGYIMNGGCSDDSFEYFRCWLIAQGKELFYAALENPDVLAEGYSNTVDHYEFEDFMYVASEPFEEKTGKDIEDFLDYDIFTFHEGEYPDFDFTWEEDDEDSMRAICPKLMEASLKS